MAALSLLYWPGNGRVGASGFSPLTSRVIPGVLRLEKRGRWLGCSEVRTQETGQEPGESMKRILVIDDESEVLQVVRAALLTRAYEVETTTSGAEGLELAAQSPPDLIICDLMMPRISGLEVIKRLKANPQLAGIPVIILSALGADNRPPEFWIRTLGVDDYIQKPFDPLDILGRVEYLFRRKNYVSIRGPVRAGAPPVSPSPGVAPDDDTANQTRSPIDVEEAEPRDVVKAFVESYNDQDFATEFHCLDEEMTGGLPLHDYVSRRRQTYVDEKNNPRRQNVLSIDEEKVSLNVAKVVITRADTTNGRQNERREMYSLKRTYKGWKIIACRSVKEAGLKPET